MPATPWRIAAQSYTVLDPETREPAFTLQFAVDHQQADVMKLRMTPATPNGAAIEMEFSTGGFVLGEPVKQPRWLKAFERPDPNLQLADDDAANEYRAGLSEEGQRTFDTRRNAFIARREEWEKVHGGEAGGPQAAGNLSGPDSTDPADPKAEQMRATQAGVETTQPADPDRKGMVAQPAGGMAGEGAAGMEAQKPLAPNAPDQQAQRQGRLDTQPAPRQKEPA